MATPRVVRPQYLQAVARSRCNDFQLKTVVRAYQQQSSSIFLTAALHCCLKLWSNAPEFPLMGPVMAVLQSCTTLRCYLVGRPCMSIHQSNALQFEIELDLRLQTDESQVTTSNMAGLDPSLIALRFGSSTLCGD